MATTEHEEKLSKKVAELILVIHALFKKNQEYKVQLDTVVELYEEELRKMSEYYETYVKTLHENIENLTKQNENNEEELKSNLRMATQIETLRSQLKAAETNILNLQLDIQNKTEELNILTLKSDKDTTPDEMDTLSRTDTAKRKNEENMGLVERYKTDVLKLKVERKNLYEKIEEYKKEKLEHVEKLKFDKRIHEKEKLRESSDFKAAVKKGNEYLEQIQKLRKQKASLMKKLKHYEEHHSLLEVEKRASELPSVRERLSLPMSELKDLEIERLKEEAEHFKMELINREENFNRLFTPKQKMMTSDTLQTKGSWNLTGVTRKSRKNGQLPQLPSSSKHFSKLY